MGFNKIEHKLKEFKIKLKQITALILRNKLMKLK